MSFSARHVESFKISAHLQTWYDRLPRHLKYFEGEDPVPPPHVLTLHMMCYVARSSPVVSPPILFFC